jgi:hypothetical protein
VVAEDQLQVVVDVALAVLREAESETCHQKAQFETVKNIFFKTGAIM